MTKTCWMNEKRCRASSGCNACRPVISEKTGKPTKSFIDRYTFPQQDCDIRDGDKLNLTDGKTWGEVVAIDRDSRTLDVKIGPSHSMRGRGLPSHTTSSIPKASRMRSTRSV